ncbi:MAG: hypothetical protein ABI697_00935 [Devosia sp.]
MHLRTTATALVAVVVLAGLAAPAGAAGPAVSAPNAKIEFDAGAFSLGSSTTFLSRFAGVVTLPVTDAFGIQADFTAATAPGFTGSAALHAFTRDPERWLIGGTLGVVATPGASVVAAGPEAELYFDRWTVEAWAGAAVALPTGGGTTRTGPFVMADVALYPHDNLRLSLGASFLDGFAAVHFGAEYLFDSALGPLSLVGEARLGQDHSVLATLGIRAYIGGDSSKTLIARHRQDDPWDRGGSLFTALGAPSFVSGGGTSSPPPPPPTCNADEVLIDNVCVAESHE